MQNPALDMCCSTLPKPVHINGVDVQGVNKIKFLGVTLGEDLSFKDHKIKYVVRWQGDVALCTRCLIVFQFMLSNPCTLFMFCHLNFISGHKPSHGP